VFESYNAQVRLLKYESVVVLTGKEPMCGLRSRCAPRSRTWTRPKKFRWNTTSLITAFSHSEASCATSLLPTRLGAGRNSSTADRPQAGKQQTVSDTFPLPDDCFVLGLYAGTDIRYGKFTKTIYAQKFLFSRDVGGPDSHQVSR